jgi:PAS domain-containing protein
VRHIAEGLGVRWVFVAECLPNLRARSLAFFQDDRLGEGFEYDLPGTPCLEVAKGRVCHVPDNLADVFPDDKGCSTWARSATSECRCEATDKRVIGHLVSFHDKPMPADPLALSVMETFANRAAVELERMRAYDHLKRQFQESEERLRDLFEEAPIAYVNEGLDSKFIRANKTALKTLGIKAEDVPHTYGKNSSRHAGSAAAVEGGFESIGKGH